MYQIYFLRTNLRKRKSQEPSTSKKVLATCKNLYFSKISDYVDQILTKNIPKCRASKTLSIPALIKMLKSLLDSLIKCLKNEIFVKSTLFVRTVKLQEYQPSSISRNHEWTQFFLLYLFKICQILESELENHSKKIFPVAKRPDSEDSQFLQSLSAKNNIVV